LRGRVYGWFQRTQAIVLARPPGKRGLVMMIRCEKTGAGLFVDERFSALAARDSRRRPAPNPSRAWPRCLCLNAPLGEGAVLIVRVVLRRAGCRSVARNDRRCGSRHGVRRTAGSGACFRRAGAENWGHVKRSRMTNFPSLRNKTDAGNESDH